MQVYEGYRCYGPYTRKDGRQHVVLINWNAVDKQRITVSYPKYVVEKALNRYLAADETVDHVDENFLNNDLSNLKIVKRSIHCKSHVMQVQKVTKHCVICGKEFETRNNSLITCSSRVCIGKCTHINGYNKGNSFEKGARNIRVNVRNLLDDVPTVADMLRQQTKNN